MHPGRELVTRATTLLTRVVDLCDGLGAVQASDDDSQPGQTPSRTRLVAMLLVSLVVAAIALWIMHAGAMPVWPPVEAWSGVRWWLVAGYAGLWVSVLVVRTYRWVWLLAPHAQVSSLRVTLVGLIGLGALVVFPMRLGELVRPVLLRRHEPVSIWTAFGTVGAERVIDGFFLSFSLLVAMWLAPAVHEFHRIGDVDVSVAVLAGTARVVFAIFAVGSVGLVIAYWKRELAKRVLDRVLRPISGRLAAFAADAMAKILAGLAFLPHRRELVAFGLMTALYWGINGTGLWLLAHACGLDLTLPQAWVILGLLALGILVPNAPGYFGVFQLSVFVGLSLYLAPEALGHRGAVFVAVLYSIQLGGTLLAAMVSWVALRFVGSDQAEDSVVAEPTS